MNSWTGDVNGDDEDNVDEGFGVTLQRAVDEGTAADLDELMLIDGVGEVGDTDLLEQAYVQVEGTGNSEKENIIANRLNELGVEVRKEEDPSVEDEDDEESSDSWGGTPVDEDDSESPEMALESGEEMEASQAEDEEKIDESEDDGVSEDSGGPPQPQNAVSVREAKEWDRRWKMMVWGSPKLFKTHYAYTMPEPIAFLDLEGKADDLAAKFEDKEVQIWQPKRMTAEPDTKFRRSKKALHEALEWLDWYREHEDRVGTIVVDSMSLMWEWAQHHHKIENYPMKDPEEVELSANFQSSQDSDWAVVKEYHNGEFRELITDSDYHFYWTAMERVAFEETFEDEDNRQIYEPRGEPNNDHKVDTIIRARKDKDRGKVGDLVGSNFTDNVFVGLKKPTFPKVRDAVRRIEKAESSSDPVSRSQLADEIDADAIIGFDPQQYD